MNSALALNSLSHHKLVRKVLAMKRGSTRLREKAGHTLKTGLIAIETGSVAFGFGVLEGKISDPKHFELFGIPLPLVAAGGFHLAAILGVGHGMEDHFAALGNGALAAHANGYGRKVGTAWKNGGAAIKGDVGAFHKGTGISQADLENLAVAT